MKILIILLVAVVICLSIGIAYQKNNEVVVEKKRLEQEVYQKLFAEEKLEKSNTKVRQLEAELSKKESQIKNTKAILDQTVKLNDDLKIRLERAQIVQQKLEEKIAAVEALSKQQAEVAAVPEL